MDRDARVLIVEESAAAGSAVEELLERAGIYTVSAADGQAALQLLYRERPRAVLLSLDLPEPSGWDVLASIRELSDIPVLVVASDGRKAEMMRALRAGADDFVAKPYARSEILARVEALLRRPRTGDDTPPMFADDFLQIDHLRHEVEAFGSKIVLTPTEFRMLVAFSRHPGQALSHSQLLELVWGAGQRDRREVKLYVSYLRRKLRAAGVEPIETVRGIGYRYRPHRVEKPRLGNETEPRRL
jgi:DNA-binding response OmpR family regulator